MEQMFSAPHVGFTIIAISGETALVQLCIPKILKIIIAVQNSRTGFAIDKDTAYRSLRSCPQMTLEMLHLVPEKI